MHRIGHGGVFVVTLDMFMVDCLAYKSRECGQRVFFVGLS